MKENFKNALGHVLIDEGGYVDNPKDPGGATNKGITLAVFQRLYGASMGKKELRNITDEQVHHIYKTCYWDKCHCDDLPSGIDYVVFDQAVNSGCGHAVRWLHDAIGVPAHGNIESQTLDALGRCSPAQVVAGMCEERLGFLKRVRNGELWKTFGKGWQHRVDHVRAYGLALAAEAEPSHVEPKSVTEDTVRRGSRGNSVRKLQEALDVDADGIFGAGTEAALRAFQAEKGLDVDGIAGRNTWQALGLD
uniref:Lysozyme family protein n=1 Tax=Candidatus Kentrum sp. FM TaxID=2126340 RepID=A0A450STT2_9GAMM|nr:MAG: Lysozyme family protein [Candidatus Kentron sp. FM]VFJ57711.1 MAG: Lysozyme family protein [Candidatus Kentron sp. FM]VFK11532.1 MAG: Lysozyme family protein [Candidatus Kentron sp. FM]